MQSNYVNASILFICMYSQNNKLVILTSFGTKVAEYCICCGTEIQLWTKYLGTSFSLDTAEKQEHI